MLRVRKRCCIVNGMTQTNPTITLRLDVVNALRKTKGLQSDHDLAAAMGLNRSSISRVMRGVSQPGPRFIAALCTALEAPMSYLFAVDEGEDAA